MIYFFVIFLIAANMTIGLHVRTKILVAGKITTFNQLQEQYQSRCDYAFNFETWVLGCLSTRFYYVITFQTLKKKLKVETFWQNQKYSHTSNINGHRLLWFSSIVHRYTGILPAVTRGGNLGYDMVTSVFGTVFDCDAILGPRNESCFWWCFYKTFECYLFVFHSIRYVRYVDLRFERLCKRRVKKSGKFSFMPLLHL